MVVDMFCIIFGLALISFGLYLRKRSKEKNPAGGFKPYVSWVAVDTLFWLCFSWTTLFGGLTLFYLLIQVL